MPRPQLESSDPLMPSDQSMERSMRRWASLRIAFVGFILVALAGGGVWVQRSMAEPEPILDFEYVREQALLRRDRILVWFREPGNIDDTQLEAKSFSDPEVSSFCGDRYVLWAVGPSTPGVAAMLDQYEVTEFPTLQVMTANGIVLNDVDGQPLVRRGFLDPEELYSFLRMAAGSNSPGRRVRMASE